MIHNSKIVSSHSCY